LHVHCVDVLVVVKVNDNALGRRRRCNGGPQRLRHPLGVPLAVTRILFEDQPKPDPEFPGVLQRLQRGRSKVGEAPGDDQIQATRALNPHQAMIQASAAR
ncbi:hypothetical protein PBRA_000881, partial [Plasmodiophora brassicae]